MQMDQKNDYTRKSIHRTTVANTARIGTMELTMCLDKRIEQAEFIRTRMGLLAADISYGIK